MINQDDLGTSTDTRISHLVRPNLLYTDPRVTVGGAYTLTRGDENSSIATPYWSQQGDGFFRYALSPAIIPGVTGYYQFQEPDVGPHFSLGRGQATGTFSFGPDGTLDVGAGGDLFAQQGVSTQVRPSGFLAYTHRFSAFAVTARYQHGYLNNSLGVDGSGVTLTRSAGIFLTSGYFRNLTTTFGIRYDENQYEQTTTVAAAGTTDRTWAVDLLFRYLIVRSLFLTLGYSGTFRSSTQESAEFNENRVRLGLTYEYNPFW